MLAAARKHGRVVQVGTQRRSTAHLIEAKKNIVDAGRLGKVGHADICCYMHMRSNGNPPLAPVPDFLDYETWTGPAPLRPYDGLPHRGWWRAFMEYGNGIIGDMGVHMLDATRWMLGLGWPKSVSSSGGIFVQKEGKSNISDTQTALFDFGGPTVAWQHRTWGAAPDPKYSWAMTLYGDKGTLKASVMSYDFIPEGKGEVIHRDCVYEREQFPEDLREQGIETPCRSRDAGPHEGLPGRRRQPRQAGGRHRTRAHLHRLVRAGERLDALGAGTGLRPGDQASRRRCRGHAASPPPVPRRLPAPGGREFLNRCRRRVGR